MTRRRGERRGRERGGTWHCAAVLLAVALVVLAIAPPAGADTVWIEDLDRRLRPQLAQRWQDLSPRERDEAIRNYQRFKKMPPEQRKAVERNYDRWRRLPKGEKERIRGNYQQYRKMSPQERRDFERRYEKWRERR